MWDGVIKDGIWNTSKVIQSMDFLLSLESFVTFVVPSMTVNSRWRHFELLLYRNFEHDSKPITFESFDRYRFKILRVLIGFRSFNEYSISYKLFDFLLFEQYQWHKISNELTKVPIIINTFNYFYSFVYHIKYDVTNIDT